MQGNNKNGNYCYFFGYAMMMLYPSDVVAAARSLVHQAGRRKFRKSIAS